MHRRGAWGRQPELGFARLPITQKKNEYWRRGWDRSHGTVTPTTVFEF